MSALVLCVWILAGVCLAVWVTSLADTRTLVGGPDLVDRPDRVRGGLRRRRPASLTPGWT